MKSTEIRGRMIMSKRKRRWRSNMKKLKGGKNEEKQKGLKWRGTRNERKEGG